MATEYIPESNITDYAYNPIKTVPRQIFNSGFAVQTEDMITYQKLMQDTIRDSFLDFMRYPGIAYNKLPDAYKSYT